MTDATKPDRTGTVVVIAGTVAGLICVAFLLIAGLRGSDHDFNVWKSQCLDSQGVKVVKVHTDHSPGQKLDTYACVSSTGKVISTKSTTS